MARGVNIPIAADASSVVREGKKVEGALEEVIDSLDDVGDASKDANKVTEKALDGIAKEADSSAEKLERSFKESFEKVEKQSKSSGDAVGHNMRDGTDGASEGLSEMGDEAAGTATEVAASFDGSAESIAGGFQEVAANAFAGFGPAGAAAGIAAAAGIGLLMSKMEEAKQKAAEAAEEIAEITGQLIEIGKRDLDVDSVKDAIEEAGTTAEDGKILINEWAKAATDAGIDYQDYAQGLAGDSEAIKRSYAEVTKKQEDYWAGIKKINESGPGHTDQLMKFTKAHKDEQAAVRAAKEELEAKDGTLNKSAATYDNVKKAQEGLVTATEEEIAATERAKEVRDSYKGALEESGDAVGVFEEILATKTEEMKASAQGQADATKEATGQAADSWEDYATAVTVTTDDLINEWNRQAEEANAFEANLAEIGANGGQALADELRAKGPEVAGATAAAIAESDPDKQRQAIDAHARATGEAVTQAMADGVTSQKPHFQEAVSGLTTGLTTPWISVPVHANTESFDRTMRQLQDGSYSAYVNGRPVGNRAE